MQFRIIGVVLIAVAIAIVWYFKPDREGKLRYPKKYAKMVDQLVAMTVTFLIGLGLPFLFFGAPGQLSFSGGG